MPFRSTCLALLLVTTGISFQPSSQDHDSAKGSQNLSSTAMHLDFDKLPPFTKSRLATEAKHFGILTDGKLVDRQNDIAYEQVCNEAEKAGKYEVSGTGSPYFSIPETEDRVRWKIVPRRGTKVTLPPLLTIKAEPAFPEVLRVGDTCAGVSAIQVVQTIDRNTALTRLRHAHIYPPASGVEAIVGGIRVAFSNGSVFSDRCYLIEDQTEQAIKEKYSGPYAGVLRFQLLQFEKDSVTAEELFQAIRDGKAELIQWRCVQRIANKNEEAEGFDHVIEWKSTGVHLAGLALSAAPRGSP